MKTGLLLKASGEISEIKFKTVKDSFKPEWFQLYNYYNTYDNYIILYNKDANIDANLSVLPFTQDKFYGDILLIKIDEKSFIINFTLESYMKIILKINIEENELYYSSDPDELIEDSALFRF